MNDGIPERWRDHAEREGLVEIGHHPMNLSMRAVRRSVPLMKDALAVFERTAEFLGERAWLDPEGGEHRRTLVRRDVEHPEWLIPKPLLVHRWLSGIGTATVGGFVNKGFALMPADAPEGWTWDDEPFWEIDQRPEVFPSGPDMRGGELEIAEGGSYWAIKYDDRGVWKETTMSSADSFWWVRYGRIRPWVIDPLARPPTQRPLSLFLREDLELEGMSVEGLASRIAELDPSWAVPARVRLPLPLPGGAAGAWSRALGAIRRAVWTGDVPPEARWVATDGFDGSALVWGTTREEALERLETRIAEVRPKPPGWKPPEEKEPVEVEEQPSGPIENEDGETVGFSTGSITLRSPASGELAWPMPVPRLTPRVLLPLPEMPSEVPEHLAGFEWIRLVGEWGEVGHALRWQDDEGFELIGEGVVDLVDDLDALRAGIDASEEAEQAWHATVPDFPNCWTDPKWPCRVLHYRIWDCVKRERMAPKQDGGRWGKEVHPPDFTNHHAWRVTRQRWQSTD